LKRADLDGSTPIRVLLDPKLDWMKRHSVLTDDDPRWSMSILAFCTSGIIRKHVRRVDPSQASQLVTDCIEAIVKETQ